MTRPSDDSPHGVLGRFLDAEERVTVYPAKWAMKRLVLEYLATRFEAGASYSEREVNEVLRRHHTFGDWVLLRRDLIAAGLLGRERDGARYWRPAAGAAEPAPHGRARREPSTPGGT
jgi:hypothetical protein